MPDVASDIKDWSITTSSNAPTDATTVGAGLADNLQQIQATVRAAFAHKGADIASATTTDLGAVPGFYHDISGTTTITGFGTVSAGVRKVLQFDGALTLTYNATSMILPGNADITTAAGDHLEAMSLGSGNWVVLWYTKDAAGAAPPFSDAIGIVRGSADATKILRIEVDGFTTGNTRVLTPPNANLTLPNASTQGQIPITTSTGVLGMAAALNKAIYGLTYANGTDATNDLDIAAGGCMDATGAYWITVAALTKQSDAAWAVGTAAGGLDTGVVGNNDYYIWAIARSDTGVTDILFSLSSTAPTMPSNYDFKRLIGWFKRSGGTIVAFDTYETEGGGLEFLWDAPRLDLDISNTLTTTQRTDTLSVPTSFSVLAYLNIYILDAAGGSSVYIHCPDTSDQAPADNASPLSNARTPDASRGDVNSLVVRTSSTGTVASRSSVATMDVYRIATVGFNWARRN